jgi:multidrug efflux pump subunit AcrA (membrane-fusion protein)
MPLSHTAKVLRPWILGALVIAGLVMLVVKLLPKSHTLGDSKHIGVVKRMDLVQNVTVAGTIVPNRRTIFSPPYNAYIRKLYVTLGQKVKEGDPVVSLEQSLRSQHEEVYPLRAPFDGTVVQILHSEGEYVETGNKDTSAMVRIDDTSKLFITAAIPETDVDKIQVGQKVLIKATAVTQKEYHGVIREISLAATEKQAGFSRSGDRVEFQVKLEIVDPDDQLKPGMSTILDIITDRRHAVLALPHEYIEKENEKYFVTLENGQRRDVQVGLENDTMFEIQSGVKEGDRVRMVDFSALPQQG